MRNIIRRAVIQARRGDTTEELDALGGLVTTVVSGNEALTQADTISDGRISKGLVASIEALVINGENTPLDTLVDSISAGFDTTAMIAADPQFLALGKHTFIASEDGMATGVSADSIADTDSIDSVVGGEFQAIVAQLNMYRVISSAIPYITGNVANIEKVKSNGQSSNRYRVYTTQAITENDAGELAEGALITPVNTGLKFASSSRDETLLADGVATSFVFNLKAVDTDPTNYKMERGVNKVEVPQFVDIDGGGNLEYLEINDYDVTSKNAIATRTVNYDTQTVTAAFDYAQGTITLTVSDAAMLPADTKVYFDAQLDGTTPSDYMGKIGTDITFREYSAKSYRIGTSIRFDDLRDVREALGIDAHANALIEALRKIIEEDKRLTMNNFYKMAIPYGETIDLTQQGNLALTSEIYKNFEVAVEQGRLHVQQTSQLNGKMVFFGGSGIVDIATKATTRTENSTFIEDSEEQGVRLHANLHTNGTTSNYPLMYDPLFEDKYPVTGNAVDGFVHTVILALCPTNPTQKPIITGIAKPMIPVPLGVDKDVNKATVIEGKFINDANKDTHSRSLVLELKFLIK